MAYDEYRERERRRMDREREFGRGGFGRESFDRDPETRWSGEGSWGYGREYDEGYPARFRTGEGRSFEGEGRPELTGGATELHPQTARRYGLGGYGRDFGWQPQGGYGQGSGYLYGWSPGEQGPQPLSYPPRHWTSRFTTAPARYEEFTVITPSYYGTASHLAAIPRGRFTGFGPKNYQRSDDRIREDVSEELAQNGEIDASGIEVMVENCVVTLEGEVEDRDQKRFAEIIAESAPGVRDVHNNLKARKGFFARLFGADEDREERVSTRESR